MQGKQHLRGRTIFWVVLLISLVGAGSAFAYRGMGGGPWARGWHLNLTPEQAGQLFDLKQKFMNETAELRKNMMVKGAELAQLWKAEQPDDKAILAKVKELSALRAQFMEKAVAQRLAVRKIVPQAVGPCPMGGPGMGPMGPGFGPLGPGPGKGRGPGAGLKPGPVADLDLAADMDLGWHNEF